MYRLLKLNQFPCFKNFQIVAKFSSRKTYISKKWNIDLSFEVTDEIFGWAKNVTFTFHELKI